MHGSSTQTWSLQVWPAPQPLPAQESTWQSPFTQMVPTPQLMPEHGSGSQNPSMLHIWPWGQVTKAQDWTQSPCRQNVPEGQVTSAQGSGWHVPWRQIWPLGFPLGSLQPV